MKIPPPGYPCKVCGTVMHDTTEGRGIKAGSYKFVACNACAQKIQVAARVGGTVLRSGLMGLLQQKAPGLLPLVQQFRSAYEQTKQQG